VANRRCLDAGAMQCRSAGALPLNQPTPNKRVTNSLRTNCCCRCTQLPSKQRSDGQHPVQLRVPHGADAVVSSCTTTDGGWWRRSCESRTTDGVDWDEDEDQGGERGSRVVVMAVVLSLPTHSLTHSFIYSSTHPLAHSFIHSSTHSLIDSFIHLFTPTQPSELMNNALSGELPLSLCNVATHIDTAHGVCNISTLATNGYSCPPCDVGRSVGVAGESG
jgi:hypothetical protein